MKFDEKGEPVKLGYYWKSQTYKFKHMAELLESQNKLLKAEIKMLNKECAALREQLIELQWFL